MLAESEYGPVHRLVLTGVRAASAGAVGDEFAAARAEFERVAGEAAGGTTFTHHRVAHFGPPCGVCSRPLRTREASRCVECADAEPGAAADGGA